MTHSPTGIEIGVYRLGDLAKVKSDEPDPIENWPAFAEENAHDMRSIRRDGVLVGCMGYFALSRIETQAFSVIDRDACEGVGRELVTAFRQRQWQWMADIGIKRVLADCPSHDRTAQVFLRAIGYRRIPGDNPDTAFFVLNWRD